MLKYEQGNKGRKQMSTLSRGMLCASKYSIMQKRSSTNIMHGDKHSKHTISEEHIPYKIKQLGRLPLGF